MQEEQKPLFINCAIHKRSYYQFLSFNVEDQNLLLCPECLIPVGQRNFEINLQKLIPLCIAISSPEQLIRQMHQDSDESLFKTFQFSNRNLEQEFASQFEIIDQIKKIVENLKIILQEQLKNYKNLQETFKKYREQFLEKLHYNQFSQMIFQLQKLDCESDEYKQVYKEITQAVTEMPKNIEITNCEEFEQLKQQYSQTDIGYSLSINSVKCYQKEKNLEQIRILFQQHSRFMKTLHDQISFTPSKIFTNSSFEFYWKEIETKAAKKLKEKNLIYQGTRDGLRAGSFWDKVDGKKNLFMIFTSKNTGSFGAYSPCQWNQSLQAHVQDNTQTSFLFLFQLEYLLTLKAEKQFTAIYCDFKNGPCFGKGDITVTSDFMIQFKLGNSYMVVDSDKEISEKLSNGGLDEIEECEIYEYIFA